MTNTPENKQRFFALYWGQEVQMHVSGNIYKVGKIAPIAPTISHLVLKPLSAISDENAIEVAKILIDDNQDFKVYDHPFDGLFVFKDNVSVSGYSYVEFWKYNIECGTYYPKHPDKRKELMVSACLFLQAYDYLRSKSYLLPFMDLTIEQILAYGWAVIK